MKKLIGSYVLVIKNKKKQKIRIGSLGRIDFEKGFFLYVGSALNNLIKRIKRHCCKHKKNKWHIDYLLKKTVIEFILLFPSEKKEECLKAKTLLKHGIAVHKFGCSDCNCFSHLIYFKRKKELFKALSEL